MLKAKLESMGACSEAVAWVGERDAATAWAECQRGDWMLWLIRKIGRVEHKTLVRIAVACARRVEDKDASGAAKRTLDVVDRWLANEANLDEVRMASEAQSVAASEAQSVAAAAAAEAAAAAARSAAAAAARSAWAAAAWSVAAARWAAERKAQADIIRSFVPFETIARRL